jgi:hypothetical protein
MAYRNDGGSIWTVGQSTQATLVFSAATPPDVRAWVASSGPAIAVQSPSQVAPSEIATFVFTYTVPDAAQAGSNFSLVAHPVLGGVSIGPDASCTVGVKDADPTDPDAGT